MPDDENTTNDPRATGEVAEAEAAGQTSETSEAGEPEASVDAAATGALPEEPAADAAPESAEPTPLPEPDARLLAAHDLALSALREITSPDSIGEPVGHAVEPDGVVSLRFANTLLGYPGWFWTVSLAVVGDAEPTVLEAELLPGDDALLAPEWVPWSVRLKEYQEQQRAAAAEAKAAAEAARAAEGADELGDEEEDATFDEFDAVESGFGFDEESEDEDEDDDFGDGDDFSEDGSSYLHAGDVDGVDIDELDAGEEADEDADGDGSDRSDAER